MSCIILQGLSKTYNSNVVVDNISLEIRDEEFMVLVGPSGCGKTTTLRIVAGLDSADGGDVFIGDRRVNDVLPRDRDIAMVFQNYALYPHMTVADNLAFGLRMRKVGETEIRRRIDEAAGLLGIGTFLKRKPGALSGGQRQRVALGRALVREPAAFLMDEPLSNLDAKLRVQMRTEILRIHKRLRTTVLYVTHDQVEAMTMGDRIVVMKDGVVQQIDTPIAIYRRPANAFVASFVGSPPMNFLPCTLGREGERLVLRGTAFEIPLLGELRSAFRDVRSAELTLGVRPEDVTVYPDTSFGNGKATLLAIVDVVEMLGPEKHLALATSGGTLTARVSSENQVRVGEHVVIGIDPKRVHAYDAATGLAYC